MKTFCSILFFVLSIQLHAQQPSAKGGAPLQGSNALQGITKALVIGISDYEDQGIPDLRFAHRDAVEFVNYLKGTAGGSLKDNQIMLLTNEKATQAQIYNALDWLVESCGPEDQVALYFSGHGDVETKTVRQQGFLLAHNSLKNNYMVGAVRLDDLNSYLETLVQSNKSKVIIITDACRSGNLAGGRDGALATATALSAQFMNQVKIMSCQPNELSMEGEQWGGGRGVFSYFLLDGLTGMADANKDSTVTLMELERYLNNTVPVETEQQQFPFTVGVKTAKLVAVDANALQELLASRTPSGLLSTIDAKGLVNDILDNADTSIQVLYNEFLAALQDQYFLPSDQRAGRKAGRSASELYDRLIHEESLRPVHPLMKRNFAAALQDESQRTINAYLRADQAELVARWENNVGKYRKNPLYLSKAASLLGEGHILHNQIKAKQFYFEGLIKRLEGGMAKDTAMLNEALALELQAIGLDSGAAYVFNEIGMIYHEMRWTYKALGSKNRNHELLFKQAEVFGIAMDLTPKWVMPVVNLAEVHIELKKFDEAEVFLAKTIELGIDNSLLVKLLGHIGEGYYFSMQYEKAIDSNMKLLKVAPSKSREWNYNIACLNALLNKPDLAIVWLDKAIRDGINPIRIQQDPDLASLRKTAEFENLMKKYFPDDKK